MGFFKKLFGKKSEQDERARIEAEIQATLNKSKAFMDKAAQESREAEESLTQTMLAYKDGTLFQGSPKERMALALKNQHSKAVKRYVEEEGYPVTAELYEDEHIFASATVLDYLLSKGLDANHFKQWSISPVKKTPLMFSVHKPELVAVLLKHKADATLKDEQGNTAFRHALNGLALNQKWLAEETDTRKQEWHKSSIAGYQKSIELLKPYADQQELDELAGVKQESEITTL